MTHDCKALKIFVTIYRAVASGAVASGLMAWWLMQGEARHPEERRPRVSGPAPDERAG